MGKTGVNVQKNSASVSCAILFRITFVSFDVHKRL